jgi:Fe-S cluster assembly protein SufD
VRPLTIETLEALAAGVDPADAARRRAAFETFEAAPMPSPKEESWRYVDLDLDLASLSIPSEPGPELPADDFTSAVSDAAGSARIVDGFVVGIDHDTKATFEVGLAGPGQVAASIDKFAAARDAFGSEGVVLEVPAGADIEAPYLIDVQASTEGSISFPSVTVRLGPDAGASVLLLYRSADGVTVAQSPQVVLEAGDASRLRLTTAQVLGDQTTTITHQRVRIGRDATVRLGEAGLGGRFARLDLSMDLVGAGSTADLVGLYFGEHRQVLDYRVVMNHIGRNTSSNVFLKGAVEDEARSVFTGLLRIEEDAIRSSAFETNRNLVLSPGATAHSVPNLEILCNDVVCGHGSSVGPLEEEHLYYLQSRGISRERAERVLIRGFFTEVIDKLPTPRLREPIQQVVDRRFVAAQQEGRIS